MSNHYVTPKFARKPHLWITQYPPARFFAIQKAENLRFADIDPDEPVFRRDPGSRIYFRPHQQIKGRSPVGKRPRSNTN
ncbi:MAG: hypothetical protein NTY66_04060 [Candidatus Vogelbacteria bacterium]|nr:hypothetical protein [Candidatus Vogelbacteria bacterium]